MYLCNDADDPTRIIEYLIDSEEACYNYFAAPDGNVTITLHFMDAGTEMRYSVPHGTYFIIVHGDEPVDWYIDEACTQPYKDGNQSDELTLYVK